MIKKSILIFVLMAGYTTLFAQIADKISKEARRQSEYAYELCRHLHQNPELSFQEKETALRMAAELRQAGLEVTENFSGNSVAGIFKNGEGPVIMIRTDMDALPVQEKTGLDFSSVKTATDRDGNEVSVMHACGHDIHMSVWTGAIRALTALRDHWKGTLVVIAQQAEEFSGGAGEAIDAGLYTKFPVPDYAMAYHINPELEAGKIGLVKGPVFAGVKSVEITVHGKGGHGAYPEKCIDPVVIASRIVLNLQTIVSREISPLDPVVVTVGSIQGGTQANIIPDRVKMKLTLRYYNDEVIEKVISAIKRISDGAALMAGLTDDMLPEVVVSPVETPPVLNDSELSGRISEFAANIIGDENIVEVSPAMVGEDFGKYGRTPEKVPICLIWLGSTNPALMAKLRAEGKEPYPLHSPFLDPDYKNTIETGIRVMTANVIGLANSIKAD
jgi:hippurate hydrolase